MHWLSRRQRDSNDHCHRWVRVVLAAGRFPKVRVLEQMRAVTEIYANFWLNAREKFWIAYYKKYGARLTNLTEGGEGQLGRVVSFETRQKIRLAQLGKKRGPCSDARRRRISEARKGKPQPESVLLALRGRAVSEETRRKIGEANKGHKPSIEARRKMSLAKIGKRKSLETRRRMSLAKMGNDAWRYRKTELQKVEGRCL